MNLTTWAEQQRQALIALGLNPLDADIIVDWLLSNLPPLQNPDEWVVRGQLFDTLRQGDRSLVNRILSAWMSSEAVEQRHRRLLAATPASAEEVEQSDDREVLGLLAAYWFLTNDGRYYSRKPFRVVSERRLRRQYEMYLEDVEDRLVELARSFSAGEIRPATWQSAMRLQLEREHVIFRALGRGGMERLTQADYDAINRLLRDESGRIETMARAVLNGEISTLQAMDRARWYAGTASTHFWQGLESSMETPSGRTRLVRNMLRPAEHCESCIRLTDLGWQLVGRIPPPKINRDCGRGCKCYLTYTLVYDEEVSDWIGTRRWP